jgi:hypothetical protein
MSHLYYLPEGVGTLHHSFLQIYILLVLRSEQSGGGGLEEVGLEDGGMWCLSGNCG